VIVTTAVGDVTTYHPVSHKMTEHAKGLNELYGVAAGPGGTVIVCEGGAGRLLVIDGKEIKVAATGLSRPTGLAVASDGSCYVAESGKGTVAHVNGGISEALGGLDRPHGLALSGDDLFVLDAGTHELICFSTKTRKRTTVATNLPVGAPPGVVPHVLSGIAGLLPGPVTAFSGLALGPDGTVYVAADAEGSILAVRRA